MEFEDLEKRARLLQGLAQPNRIRLMRLLWMDGPCGVSRLANLTMMSVGNTSQHLLKLHNLGLVQRSAKGQMKIYEVGPASLAQFVRDAVMDIPAGS